MAHVPELLSNPSSPNAYTPLQCTAQKHLIVISYLVPRPVHYHDEQGMTHNDIMLFFIMYQYF